MQDVKRGDVFYCELGEGVGSEQGGRRPVVVLQNNIGNRYSPTIIVAPTTTRQNKAKLPTHVNVRLEYDSIIMLEQIRTVDRSRLMEKLTTLTDETMRAVNAALRVSVNV